MAATQHRHNNPNNQSKEDGKNIKYHTWPETPYGKVTKTQENITHKRAKRSAL